MRDPGGGPMSTGGHGYGSSELCLRAAMAAGAPSSVYRAAMVAGAPSSGGEGSPPNSKTSVTWKEGGGSVARILGAV